jgi:uncharacterized protein with GYD domain
MALYMTQWAYTAEAWQALAKKPYDHRAGVELTAKKLGGRLISLYYTFGEYDAVVVFEAPNDRAAATVALAMMTTGHLKVIKTTSLMVPEDMLEVEREAGSFGYTNSVT